MLMFFLWLLVHIAYVCFMFNKDQSINQPYGTSSTERHCMRLEMVQHRAARNVKSNHRRTSNLTQMLHELGWDDSLADRRRDLRS